MLKVAILDDYQNVSQQFINIEKLSGKYEFKISEGVLIPRPDTETIIEQVLKISKEKSKLKILDIGVGSGCIILSILKDGAGDIKILPIVSSNSKSASRIIIRARKSAKGDTKLLNPLFLYKDEKKIGQKKQYTSEIHNILRNGYGLNF